MPSLILPTEDESSIDVTYGDKNFRVDVLDVQKMLWEAGEIATSTGDKKSWRAIFLDLFNREYEVVLTPTAAHLVAESAVSILSDLKKKSFPSLESQDSTEELSQDENSDS